MASKTEVVLLTSLLASAHCQPPDGRIGVSRDYEDHPDLDDYDDVSGDLKHLEDILPVTSEDLHNYVDTFVSDARLPSQEALDWRNPQGYPEGRSHTVGLFLEQLLPVLAETFFRTVITHLFNWFYPFKVVPPPPGLLGVSQLWGGLPNPNYWHHRWGHLHLKPGKYGNDNWGYA